MISHRSGNLLTPFIGAALFLVQSSAQAAPEPTTSTAPAPLQKPVTSRTETSVAELSIKSRCPYPGSQGLTIAEDGSLYGICSTGGRFGMGFIFKLNRDAFSRPSSTGAQPADFSIVRAFGDSRDQQIITSPVSLVRGGDGKFYLNSQTGDQWCTQFDPKSQSIEPIRTDAYSADAIDGMLRPLATLSRCFAVDADGMLWCRGINGLVFHTRGDSRDFGALTQTRSWTSAVDGGDGYFYGTTLDSIEKIKKDGSDYGVLHKFTGADNGTTEPVGRPVVVKNGMVYGYAHPDQSTGLYSGILYKIDRQGNNFAIVESLNTDPDGVLFADGNCVYGVSAKGFYRVCDPQSEVTLIAPSKKQHYLKAMAFDDKFAYALAENDSIFRISLPSTMRASK